MRFGRTRCTAGSRSGDAAVCGGICKAPALLFGPLCGLLEAGGWDRDA